MKLIDRNGRLFGKVSVIDLIVVVVVLILAVALNMKNNHLSHTSTSVSNDTITYQYWSAASGTMWPMPFRKRT